MTEEKEWDSFEDDVDWIEYEDEGVALLRRKYMKWNEQEHQYYFIEGYMTDKTLAPVVAMGVTAYLSYWPTYTYRSMRTLIYEKAEIDTESIFRRYFKHSLGFLASRERKKPLNRKSETELIREQLKNEKFFFEKSSVLFTEVKDWEGQTISEIREVALYYPVWVKQSYLKEGNARNNRESVRREGLGSSRKLILFKSPDIIEKIFKELKGYFPGHEQGLLKALQGERLKEPLLFPHNQNKFVEVFKRLKYDGYLISTPAEINEWICSDFSYRYKKGDKTGNRDFNRSTVSDMLTREKGEPTRKERICVVEWLPYKNQMQRRREEGKEI